MFWKNHRVNLNFNLAIFNRILCQFYMFSRQEKRYNRNFLAVSRGGLIFSKAVLQHYFFYTILYNFLDVIIDTSLRNTKYLFFKNFLHKVFIQSFYYHKLPSTETTLVLIWKYCHPNRNAPLAQNALPPWWGSARHKILLQQIDNSGSCKCVRAWLLSALSLFSRSIPAAYRNDDT